MLNLFPDDKKPYFLWAPPYDENSSGVRALHLLCHALNEVGQRAYLIPVNMMFGFNPALNVHILDQNIAMYYQAKGIDPIFIYPDVVTLDKDQELDDKKIVRWLLAEAGTYGGDKVFPPKHKVYGYTKNIHENVLCLPTFDERVFHMPVEPHGRKGFCFYSHKYDKIHGNPLQALTYGMTRCEGTPEQVAEILRTHEACYIYERSEILVNAALCGCKVVPIVSDYWNGELPEEFFNEEGSLVPQWRLRYDFEKQLMAFIQETQEWA